MLTTLAYDAEAHAFTRDLKSCFEAIREEYRNLDAPILPLHRNCRVEEFVERLKAQETNGWTASWQVGTPEPNTAWLTYFLKFYEWFPQEAVTKFPRTMDALRHPACEMCAFSVLRPLSIIGPHAHSRMGDRLILHLGLDMEPGKSFISVNGNFIEERNGELLVFDGSQEHFSINASLEPRAILYMEFDSSKI